MNDVNDKDNFTPAISETRSMIVSKEIEAKITVALKFPRDMDLVEKEIKRMCARPRFADGSVYGLPRGDKVVNGPSVQFAKGVANLYKNIEHGHTIEERSDTYTKGFGYAWDYQNNINIKKDFYVKHERFLKGGRIKIVIDHAEISELVNAQISRAVRNCLLEIIPTYVIDEALDLCVLTMKDEAKKSPIEKRREQSKVAFAEYGVTDDVLKKKMGKTFIELNDEDLFDLRKAYSAIKDRFITVDRWLGVEVDPEDSKTNNLNDKLKNTTV